MARSTYLGTTNDTVFEKTASGYWKTADDAKTLRFWSAATGGTRHTDLLVDGVAATELVVPANAAFAPAVDGPDGVNDGWWIEVVGVTGRVFNTPSKPLTEAKAYADTQVATRETPAGAQAKADAAAAASIPLAQKGAANGVAALGADGRAAEAQLPAHLAQTSLSAAYAPVAHPHPVADITATGTRDATTYLRGDGTWAPVSMPSVHAYQHAPATPATQTIASMVGFTRYDFPVAWGLSRTFTPATNLVQVTLSAYAQLDANEVAWTIYDVGGAVELAGARVMRPVTARAMHTLTLLVPATAGVEKTWKWQFYATGTSAVTFEAGAPFPAVMVLRSA